MRVQVCILAARMALKTGARWGLTQPSTQKGITENTAIRHERAEIDAWADMFAGSMNNGGWRAVLLMQQGPVKKAITVKKKSGVSPKPTPLQRTDAENCKGAEGEGFINVQEEELQPGAEFRRPALTTPQRRAPRCKSPTAGT